MTDTMTEKQLADRLALIKEIAARPTNVRAQKMVGLKAASRKQLKKVAKTETVNVHGINMPKERAADHYWTDASKYANEYYGERMRQTTWHDNEWD